MYKYICIFINIYIFIHIYIYVYLYIYVVRFLNVSKRRIKKKKNAIGEEGSENHLIKSTSLEKTQFKIQNSIRVRGKRGHFRS